MRATSFLALVLLLMANAATRAQISFKTEYFGTSGYLDSENNKIKGSKGSAMVYKGDIRLPLSVKTNKDSLAVIWGVGISGAYASLHHENIPQDLVLSHMTNLQLSLFNVQPLNKKWSLISFAGVGIYTDETQFSKMKARSILGSGGAIFVKKFNPKLSLGAGLALNNAFGYPMVFPALYLDYHSQGKYVFKVSMLSGFQASAGYTLNPTLSLHLVAEMNGQMALLEQNNKEVTFTHQYVVTGFRPEFKLTRHITLPITLGINATRSAYFTERSLKSIFSDREYNPHFTLAPYAAAEINYKF